MISRNYKRQINSSMTKQSDALDRSESGLAFRKLSDNVSAGSRAMHIQEQRYAATQQLNNVKDLLAEQKSIDSNLSSIHSILQKVQERVLTGMSEDWGATSRDVIAQEIAQKREQLLQFANAQYAGHTLFGGTNNSVPPFTVNEHTGKLQFNGIDVDQIFKSAVDGKYYYYPGVEDPKHAGSYKYNFSLSGTLNGPLAAYGDGITFHLDDGVASGTFYTEIDGTRYYSDGNGLFTNSNGDAFKTNGTGFDQVVIDGVTYVKNGDYYYEEGVDPVNNPEGIVGKVFKSADGLTFTEMETELVYPDDPDYHIPTVNIKGELAGGTVKSFTYPDDLTEEPLEFKLSSNGKGFDQVVIGGKNFVKSGTDASGNLIYTSTDPKDKSVYISSDGLSFDQQKDPTGNDTSANNVNFTFTVPQKELGEPKVVPNSGHTYADIGLGLKINNSFEADPRTAYQVSFSGLDIMGCAGISYDWPPTHPGTIYGDKNNTAVSGNLYDLLGQIENALSPNFDKNALDDLFTQLVNLTDEVGMVRTDLGNRMEYLELTETRLDEDIFNMTTLETDLVSSDPAEEAIKMKECEYVWLALMQLGSKVLPASLLDFIS